MIEGSLLMEENGKLFVAGVGVRARGDLSGMFVGIIGFERFFEGIHWNLIRQREVEGDQIKIINKD